MMTTWKKRVGSVFVLGGVMAVGAFVGVRAALAIAPGARGGHSRTALSVAGTINGGAATGATVMVDYVFVKGTTESCRVPTLLNRNTSNGHFTGEVDIERCPTDLFDGSDVTVRVEAGGAAVATGPVNPVPYARFADQVGVNNDCPVGYELSRPDTYWTIASGRRLCIRYLDSGRSRIEEVVRVGRGASAFWIDRFESSVYGQADGSGPNYGAIGDDYGDGFPDNGQWTTSNERYALSIQLPLRSGTPNPNAPARFITWFQANAACRLAGKRLPTGDEWLTAAHGTDDRSSNGEMDGACRTLSGGRYGDDAREAGQSNVCRSRWGAHDMIGNLSEWTADWYAAPGTDSVGFTNTWADFAGPSSSYGSDYTWNVASQAVGGVDASVQGLPSAALRGGSWNMDGRNAGIFALDLRRSPSSWHLSVGFRCVIPR